MSLTTRSPHPAPHPHGTHPRGNRTTNPTAPGRATGTPFAPSPGNPGATRPAGSAPDLAVGYVLACPDCETSGGPFPTRAEAEALAAVHDRLHHAGAPTAQVTGGGVCESCQTRPATIVWPYPPAGAPFQLCGPCWTATTDAASTAGPGRAVQGMAGVRCGGASW